MAPLLEVDERRRRTERVGAVRVEILRRQVIDEVRHQPRNAAAADDVVALTLGDQQACIAQALQNLFAVAWRRDRVELAFEHENRLVRLQRRVEIVRARAARPDFALRTNHVDQRRAEHGVLVLRAWRQQVGVFGADHRDLHAVVAQFGQVAGQQLRLPPSGA
jgi:hypothetical protein